MAKKKILIADDESDGSETLSALLEMKGYDVINVSDSQSILTKAKNESLDLIILDVIMPNMDGYEVCQRLKNDIDMKHIPVIMLTALSYDELRLKPHEVGANDYMVKPYRIASLLEKINKLLYS
jgi:DNA-binding response OmpR family regulator